jgi:hypothetical protein
MSIGAVSIGAMSISNGEDAWPTGWDRRWTQIGQTFAAGPERSTR